MKKIIYILILSIFLFTGCKQQEEETTYERILANGIINLGISDNTYPFGFCNQETNSYEGFDIDIAKKIASDILGCEECINYIVLTPNERIEAITSKKVDMVVSTMSITPQREYFIDFSQPYYTVGQTALVNKDSNIYSFYDLKDKKIIVLLGTTSERNIRRLFPTAKVIGYKSHAEAFKAFTDGGADAYSTDNSILFGYVQKHPEYRMLKNKISKEYYAIGFKKEENDSRLKNHINMIITRMQKDGSLDELKEKWGIKQ